MTEQPDHHHAADNIPSAGSDTQASGRATTALVIDVFGGFDLEDRQAAHERADAIAAEHARRGKR